MPAFDAASTTADAASGTTDTCSHTTGTLTNGIIVGAVYHDVGTTVTGATYNGVACTQLFTQAAATDDTVLDVWFLKNPAAGTHDFVSTFNASSGFNQTGVSTYSGVDQTTPFGTPDAYGPGSTEPFTRTIASSVGDLVLDWALTVSDGGTQNLAPGASQTERWECRRSSLYRDMAQSEKAGAASVSMSYTDDAATVYHSAYGAVNLKAAAAGGPVQVPYQPHYGRAPVLAQ